LQALAVALFCSFLIYVVVFIFRKNGMCKSETETDVERLEETLRIVTTQLDLEKQQINTVQEHIEAQNKTIDRL